MVRSVLLYAIEVWSPSSKTDMGRLERVQRVATRYICNVSIRDGISYTDRLRMCNLTPLNTLCDVKLIMFTFKLVHDLLDVKSSDLINFSTHTRYTRLGNDVLRLNIPRIKIECYRSWMVVRACYTWNSLPKELRSLTPVNHENKLSVVAFKKHLVNHIDGHFDANFDPNLPCTWRLWCPCYNCR